MSALPAEQATTSTCRKKISVRVVTDLAAMPVHPPTIALIVLRAILLTKGLARPARLRIAKIAILDYALPAKITSSLNLWTLYYTVYPALKSIAKCARATATVLPAFPAIS